MPANRQYVFTNAAALTAPVGSLRNGATVVIEGYYAAGDGGGQELIYRSSGRSGIDIDGGFYFTGPGADDYFESVSKASEWVNVRKFGAKGDNSADDSAAVLAAVAAANNATYPTTVYFPAGTYRVDAKLQPAAGVSILGDSEDATLIIQFGTTQTLIEVAVVYHAQISNISLKSLGHAIEAPTNTQKLAINNVILQPMGAGKWGLYNVDATFEVFLRNINCPGNGSYGANGVMLSSHSSIQGCTMTGMNIGILVCDNAIGAHISEARLEVNNIAVAVGYEADGVTSGVATNTAISNSTFESNGVAIDINSATLVSLSNILVTAYADAAPGGVDATHGIVYRTASGVIAKNVTVSGTFSGNAGVTTSLLGGTQDNCIYSNVIGPSWNTFPATLKSGDVRGVSFTGSTSQSTLPKINSSDAFIGESTDRIRLHSLQQLDYLTASVSGKNLCGTVSPTTSATTHAVVFGGSLAGGFADISGVTPTTGGSLASGTYYYMGSAITRAGEAKANIEWTAVVSNPNNAVAITFYGTAHPRYKRRIYRGTAAGVYTGYYELSENASSYTDTGAAFTQAGAVFPLSNNDNSCDEPDANYMVIATPSWATLVHVTSKATTGFTLNFSVAVPSGGKVDYVIVR